MDVHFAQVKHKIFSSDNFCCVSTISRRLFPFQNDRSGSIFLKSFDLSLKNVRGEVLKCTNQYCSFVSILNCLSWLFRRFVEFPIQPVCLVTNSKFVPEMVMHSLLHCCHIFSFWENNSVNIVKSCIWREWQMTKIEFGHFYSFPTRWGQAQSPARTWIYGRS